MDWSAWVVPALTFVAVLGGTLLGLWGNRRLVAAQAHKAVAEAGAASATARHTDAETTRVVVDLYQKAFDDMKGRLTAIEANQALRDSTHAALITNLNDRIGELEEIIIALKDEISNLVGQIRGMGAEPDK